MEPVKFSLSIDGFWSAKDFSEVVDAVDTIYRMLGRYHSEDFSTKLVNETRSREASSHNQFSSAYRLMIVSAQYKSPGYFNFQGLGEVARETRLFLESLIFFLKKKKQADAEISLSIVQAEAVALENLSKRMELLDKAFKMSDARKLPDNQRQQIITSLLTAQRPLIHGIDDGRITDAGDETRQ